MKIAILTNVQRSAGRVAVAAEAARRGHTLDFVSYDGVEISSSALQALVERFATYDVVHHAGGLGVSVAAKLHELLEARGVVCVNSFSRVPLSVGNKVFQAVCLAQAEVPVPKTWCAHRPDFEMLCAELGQPFVAKDPRGTQGASVWRIQSQDDLGVLTPGREYIFQEFIPNDGDFRVHVAGGSVFCPYRRVPGAGEFRSNVSLGATVTRIDEAERATLYDIALRAARAMRLDYCGVDIVRSSDDGRYLVLETNSDPGFKDVEETTGESYAIPIVEYYEHVGVRNPKSH